LNVLTNNFANKCIADKYTIVSCKQGFL
jgi:hypothetical protein